MSFSSVHDGPAVAVAHDTLSRLIRERQIERYPTWQRTRGAYPRAWREAATDDAHVFWMTAEELRALSQRLTDELVSLYRERLTDPSLRPDGALPVEMLLLSYPMTPAPPSAPPDVT